MLSLEMRDDRSEKVRYDYADYPIYIRRALLSSYPGYAAPTHWHDDLEFIAVLSEEMQDKCISASHQGKKSAILFAFLFIHLYYVQLMPMNAILYYQS